MNIIIGIVLVVVAYFALLFLLPYVSRPPLWVIYQRDKVKRLPDNIIYEFQLMLGLRDTNPRLHRVNPHVRRGAMYVAVINILVALASFIPTLNFLRMPFPEIARLFIGIQPEIAIVLFYLIMPVTLILGVILPLVLGLLVAKWGRVPEHGWLISSSWTNLRGGFVDGAITAITGTAVAGVIVCIIDIILNILSSTVFGIVGKILGYIIVIPLLAALFGGIGGMWYVNVQNQGMDR